MPDDEDTPPPFQVDHVQLPALTHDDLHPPQERAGLLTARELALLMLRYAELLREQDPGLADKLLAALEDRAFL